jgi:hypothetical protein
VANPSYTTMATATTYRVFVDWSQTPFNLTAVVEVPSGTTISWTMQYTVDDPNNFQNETAWTTLWIADPTNGTSQTTTKASFWSNPITGLQVTVGSISGGVARFAVLQGMPN